MRTNIDIDDQLLAQAMRAGPYSTKKATVDAGLRLLAQQAAYREVLKWEGKLKWEGDESIDWTQPAPDEMDERGKPAATRQPRPRHEAKRARRKAAVTA
ncbi:MAG: type II toxin-antitoxin system VapB family antitoxin [Desulfovibrionaceae bacterium]|jgi:Arc/MetJ family transcription regulator|nr:type II toxin-antitoxin system VapB family antitoxin [Desulfovibrionaceae bacterium]